MLIFKNNKGDTIIEVLLAFTIFSLLVVGGIAVMNQGSATAQRSLEITLVRNEIDSQAEALRFLNASYTAGYQTGASSCGAVKLDGPAGQWQKIHCEYTKSTVSDFGECPTSITSKDFIINPKTAILDTATFAPAQTFAQIKYSTSSPNSIANIYGIWIEAVKPDISYSNQSNAGYIDFHIRACWDGPGQSGKMTLGTIVRLYEPRG